MIGHDETVAVYRELIAGTDPSESQYQGAEYDQLREQLRREMDAAPEGSEFSIPQDHPI